eukprot:scaffold7.g3682.t1
MSTPAVVAEWSKGFSKIHERQKLLQTAHGFMHKKLPGDTLTSRIVPLGLTVVAAALVGRGLFFMYTGTGKLE